MIRGLPFALALSLSLTLALETGFFFLAGKRNGKDLLLVILANVLTNPVVVLTYWLAAMFTDWNLVVVIVPLELSAVFVEGFCYKKYGLGFKRPYLFSAGANAFSYGVGLLMQMLL